jgi:hypothetical protein
VTDIFAISINDTFVQKAFKSKLAPEGTKVRFVAGASRPAPTSLPAVARRGHSWPVELTPSVLL